MLVNENDEVLQHLLSHLYGSALGRIIAGLAQAREGERVLIIGPEGTSTAGISLPQGDLDAAFEALAAEDGPSDPLPVIEFLDQPGPVDLRLRIGGPWDVLIGFPPQGSRRSQEFQSFLEAAAASASPRGRAVLILVEGLVAGERSSYRTDLLGAGSVENLVIPSSRIVGGRMGMHPSLRLVVACLRPNARATSGMTQVRRPETPGLEELVFEVRLPPDQPWTIASLDPDRAAKLETWRRDGNAQPLRELASFPRPSRMTGRAPRVLRPIQITSSGLDLDADAATPTHEGERFVGLQAGDLVGRALGVPHWTILDPSEVEGGLAATQHVIVIRAEKVHPRYLLGFLRSDAAAGQLEGAAMGSSVQRVSHRALRELLIPVMDISLGDGDPIRRFRILANDLADKIEARYRTAFDVPRAAAVTAALAAATDDAAIAASLLEQVMDPLHRARQALPHPLARTLRVYLGNKRRQSPVDMYQDLLRFGETAIILLGSIGMAYLNSIGGDGDLDDEWERNLSRSGVSLGTWLRVANLGAEAARRSSEPLGGLATALRTKSPLNAVLETFLEARNDQAHGAGPRSPYEYEQRTLDLEEALHVVIHELSPLERSEWFVIDHLAWSARNSTFTASGRSLKGDHPDFEPWASEKERPLESNMVYVQLGRLDLNLAGFCTLRACSRCLHEELYYPDRLRGSMVRLRSLDRGHECEVPLADAGLRMKSSR